MISINDFLLGNEKDLYKKSIIWNMMSGILSASQSSIMIFFVIRMSGTYDAGILSIAYATSYLMLTIGFYGMRNFQVTDINHMFEFKHYIGSRVITCFLMMGISIIYILFKPYSFDKSIIVLSFCFFKMIDAIEDIFHGLYQQKDRLDVAGKAMSLRLILSTIYFLGCYFITSNLVTASITTSIFSLFVFLILNYSVFSHFGKLEVSFKFEKISRLFILCLPLFLAAFLNIYISNTPKYAIDSNLSEEVQAYFGILFTPVYLIKLFSVFIYRPKLTKMAHQWNEGNKGAFKSMIIKQVFVIFVMTLIIAVGACYYGTPIMTFIYNQNMNPYRLEFVILLLGGGMTAVVDFINTSLTIIRAQSILLAGYSIVAILSFLLAAPVVEKFSLSGASILYTVIFCILAIIFGSYLFLQLQKHTN